MIIALFYSITRLPALSQAERDALAEQYAFEAAPLPTLAGYVPEQVREVHPSLQHISSWISSVGAGVALTELDRDGLSNDICYVNTSIDQVVVTPAPHTGTRYAPFALQPDPLPYDAGRMAPMGCLPGDLNEDGWMDLLVYYWGRTPVAFLQRPDQGPLTLASFHPQEIMPYGDRWFTNTATRADIDGDGHADLIFGNYFQDGAQILNADDDTPQSMQHSMARALNGGTNHLLLWSGATGEAEPGVTFTEPSGVLTPDLAMGWTLAVGAADLNGDLLPELYFANDFGPDRLLLNQSEPGQPRFTLLHGERTWSQPKSKVLGWDSFKGMGVDFGDLNGDGLFDIYVSNIAAEFALEESHFLYLSTGEIEAMERGIAPYVDRSEELGLSRSDWGWDSRLGDFNNDGQLEAVQATGFVRGEVDRWPELHELAMSNDELLRFPAIWPQFQPGDDISGQSHNPFFVRASDGRFYDLAPEIGINQQQVTRGIATGDVDGNGTLDFVVANQWDTSYFYRNDCPDCGAFLGLHLLLPVGSAPWTVQEGHPTAEIAGYAAIGATVSVLLPDGSTQVSRVDGGSGHSGVRSPEIHIGLGELPATSLLDVTVTWRDAAGQPQSAQLSLTPGWHTVLLGER